MPWQITITDVGVSKVVVAPSTGLVTPWNVLIVAGGGGGGAYGGGGAGGGLIYKNDYVPLAGERIQLRIGAGGNGAPQATSGNSVRGSNGNNTSFGALVAIGGGGGGGGEASVGSGLAGGSGGGGGANSGPHTGGLEQQSGSASSGFGSNGGTGVTGAGGGGGGAGQAGQIGIDTPSFIGGKGGDGKEYFSAFYGGGGGGGSFGVGGAAGAGGGGAGGSQGFAGINASANTGGGGGGGALQGASPFIRYAGGNGGSGIIIISGDGTAPTVEDLATFTERAPTLNSQQTFCCETYNGKIYAGTSPNGRLHEWDAINLIWVQVAPTLNSIPRIRGLLEFDGNLYGCTSFVTTIIKGRLFKWNGTNAWVQVAGELGTNEVIYSLSEFNGELYGFSSSTTGGGKLLKWNGVDAWVQVGAPASTIGTNDWAVRGVVYDNKIYIGYGGLATSAGRLFEWTTGDSTFVQAQGAITGENTFYPIAYEGELYFSTYTETGAHSATGRLFKWISSGNSMQVSGQFGSETGAIPYFWNNSIIAGSSPEGHILEWDNSSLWNILGVTPGGSGLSDFTTYEGNLYGVRVAGDLWAFDYSPPVVTTNAVTLIEVTSATYNGNVTGIGGSAVTERGFVYNTTGMPNVTDTKVIVAGTTGAYSGEVTGLAQNAVYFVRAYAINDSGVGYGTVVSFTTLSTEDNIFLLFQEFLVSQSAGIGTGDTTLKLTAHGLTTGDMIVNTDRKVGGIPSSSYVTYVDDDTLTTRTITGQVSGDTIRLYKFIDRTDLLKSGTLNIMRNSQRQNSAMFDLIVALNTVAADTFNVFIPRAGQNIKIFNNADLIYGGSLQTVNINRIGNSASNKYVASCFSEGYGHIPSRRTVDDEFNDVDIVGLNANYIVNFMIDNYLIQEGISAGTINDGADVAEYPPQEGLGYTVRQALDDMAEKSGCSWFIDDNRLLQFITLETVGVSSYTLEDAGAFEDFWHVEAEETLEEYRNKQFVRGGVDADTDQVLVGSTDFVEVLDRQNREGGSGVYGDVFENQEITAFTSFVAGAGTTTTNLELTAHGLLVGDVVINTTRLNAKRQILTVVDVNNVTVDAVTGQVSTDAIKTYPDANLVMRRLLQTYKGAKKIRFRTTATDFRPVTKLVVDLAQVKAVGDFMIESVSIIDIDGKNLQSEVSASKRDFTNLSSKPLEGWLDYFRRLVEK